MKRYLPLLLTFLVGVVASLMIVLFIRMGESETPPTFSEWATPEGYEDIRWNEVSDEDAPFPGIDGEVILQRDRPAEPYYYLSEKSAEEVRNGAIPTDAIMTVYSYPDGPLVFSEAEILIPEGKNIKTEDGPARLSVDGLRALVGSGKGNGVADIRAASERRLLIALGEVDDS